MSHSSPNTCKKDRPVKVCPFLLLFIFSVVFRCFFFFGFIFVNLIRCCTAKFVCELLIQLGRIKSLFIFLLRVVLLCAFCLFPHTLFTFCISLQKHYSYYLSVKGKYSIQTYGQKLSFKCTKKRLLSNILSQSKKGKGGVSEKLISNFMLAYRLPAFQNN